jgi:hypothetical protein
LTPTDEDLLAFDSGLLADEVSDTIVRWLETHPEGEDRLRRLCEGRPEDAVEALRQPADSAAGFV